jgi:hypothetical protein
MRHMETLSGQCEDMWDHARSVFEKNATKLMSESISNEYVQMVEGQQTSSFHDGLDTYLTEEQYATVKHVGLNFISCLLCLYYF